MDTPAVNEVLLITNGLALNGGTINIGANSTLVFKGGSQSVTTTSSGTINGVGGSAITDIGTVTFDEGVTLTGSVNIGGAGTVINDGMIDANTSGDTILIDPTTFTNAGTVEASNGGTVDIPLASNASIANGNTLTSGIWNVTDNSTINLHTAITTIGAADVFLENTGSTFSDISELASIAGGFGLGGGATFTTTGDLTNSGFIGVGPGQLNVDGTYTQTGTLDIGYTGSTAVAGYGQVTATTADLGGTLIIDSFGGPGPAFESAIEPVTYGSLGSQFTTITSNISGTSFIPTYNTGNLSLFTLPTGVTTYWIGGSGTDWGTAANWSNGAVPTTADTAYIGLTATVTFSGTDSSVIAGLYVDGTLNITGGGLGIGASAGSNAFSMSSGVVDGAGVINVNGTASWSGGTMQGSGTTNFNGATTIGGSGTELITLAGGRVLGGGGAPALNVDTLTVGAGGATFNFTNGGLQWQGGAITLARTR